MWNSLFLHILMRKDILISRILCVRWIYSITYVIFFLFKNLDIELISSIIIYFFFFHILIWNISHKSLFIFLFLNIIVRNNIIYFYLRKKLIWNKYPHINYDSLSSSILIWTTNTSICFLLFVEKDLITREL